MSKHKHHNHNQVVVVNKQDDDISDEELEAEFAAADSCPMSEEDLDKWYWAEKLLNIPAWSGYSVQSKYERYLKHMGGRTDDTPQCATC